MWAWATEHPFLFAFLSFWLTAAIETQVANWIRYRK
jgi:hypothetical protein